MKRRILGSGSDADPHGDGAAHFAHEAEEAVHNSLESDGKYLVDQDSNFGAVFTRLAPTLKLSKTTAYSETGPAVIGAHDPFLTGWYTELTADGTAKHRPSEMLKRGLLGFIEGYGHEDVMLRKS